MIISDYAESNNTATDYFQSNINKGSTTQKLAANFGIAYASISDDPKKSISILEMLMKTYPGKISFVVTYAKALQANKQGKLAIQTLEQLLARNPDNYSATDTLIEIYLQNDLIENAERLLLKLTHSQAENPRVWYLLAETHGLAGHIVDLHLARAEYFYLSNRLSPAIEQLGLALKKNRNNEQLTARIQKRMNELYELKNNPIF